MAATSTYNAPGMTRSWVSGAGAREAMVLVKEDSRCRNRDIRALTWFSVTLTWAWVKRRTRRIWTARRSVGVGVLGSVRSDGVVSGTLFRGGISS